MASVVASGQSTQALAQSINRALAEILIEHGMQDSLDTSVKLALACGVVAAAYQASCTRSEFHHIAEAFKQGMNVRMPAHSTGRPV